MFCNYDYLLISGPTANRYDNLRERVIYSVIRGASQGGCGYYTESYEYIAAWACCSVEEAIEVINKLLVAGHITRVLATNENPSETGWLYQAI